MILTKLEKKLDFFFKNKKLLLESISHKSYSKKNNNKKLEFLGDSILNFIITKKIYNDFYYLNIGEISKIRSFLIKSEILVKIFNKLDIKNFIYNFILKNKYFNISNSIMENILESIIGAIYIDSGFFEVKKFIYRQYKNYFILINKNYKFFIQDNKTDLQELTKKKFLSLPKYIINKIYLNKLNNKKVYFILCKIKYKNKILVTKGYGFTKKNAEKLSAKKMINFIKINNI